MFESARLKLTAWYLCIIMLISMLFSVVIYTNVNNDLIRIETRQRRVQERMRAPMDQFLNQLKAQGIPTPPIQNRPPDASMTEVAEARNRLILVLIFINLGILVISGIAGYFLAGQTLQPIKEMVDEQNRFITDASHELRTPLTSLRSEMEVTLADKHLKTGEAREVITSNLEDVIRLQTLSDNLLELAQFEKSTLTSHFSQVKLADVLHDAVKKVSGIAKKKQIPIQNEIKDPVVHGNYDSLSELFVILLDNAIKYSPEKSIVTIASQKTDHHVIIGISDQGAGIAASDIPHIFDRFYRADKSRTSQSAKGYGLGLSIAKKIVDAHRGTLSVKSAVGRGTTFFVELPCKKA